MTHLFCFFRSNTRKYGSYNNDSDDIYDSDDSDMSPTKKIYIRLNHCQCLKLQPKSFYDVKKLL